MGFKTKKARRFALSRTRKAGECSITQLESGIVDYDQVFQFIQDLIQENDLECMGICYDPYNANSLISKAEKPTTQC